MKISRLNLVSLGLVLASFVGAAALYDRLPDLVPTHWNARGRADGFIAKPWGPFVLPLLTAFAYALMRAIPRLSPRGYRVERFQGTFDIIQTAIVAFLSLVTLLALLSGIGAPIPMARAMYAGVGLLFVVLGNFMGKLTRNFFVGIRTPWTLASEEVWLRTHRLGGKLFVLAGLALLVAGLLGGGTGALIVAVLVAAGVPAVYSYVIYRRLERQAGPGAPTGDEPP